jgi:hypothetical protein
MYNDHDRLVKGPVDPNLSTTVYTITSEAAASSELITQGDVREV